MHKLLQQIRDNKELLELEEVGFQGGDEKGKTMDVPFYVMVPSLEKQIEDFYKSYTDWLVSYRLRNLHKTEREKLQSKKDDMKRTLADLRNVTGCLFLKLTEEESKRE